MRKTVTLFEAVTQLAKFDPADTIYAAEPWTPHSSAIIAYAPDDGGRPPEVAGLGLVYFLEVDIALEVLSDWTGPTDGQAHDVARCRRLIEYAENDA